MTDTIVSGILSALLGAAVGGMVSFLLARQQSRTQLMLAQEEIAAQQKQITDQRQWEARERAVALITTIFVRMEPIDPSNESAKQQLQTRLTILRSNVHNEAQMLSYQLELAGMSKAVAGSLNEQARDYIRALEAYAGGQMSWDQVNHMRVETRDALISLALEPADHQSIATNADAIAGISAYRNIEGE